MFAFKLALLIGVIIGGFVVSPAMAVGQETSQRFLYQQLQENNGRITLLDNDSPLYKLMAGNNSIVQNSEVFIRQEFNPLVPNTDTVFLNASFEEALTGPSAFGELLPMLELRVSQAIARASAELNKSSIDVGILFATLDLRINGTTLVGNELVRLAFDRLLSYMERTTDTFVLLIGSEATARNLVKTIAVAEKSVRVNSIKVAGLTHGYAGKLSHGFVSAVGSQAAMVNGADLKTIAQEMNLVAATKIAELLLPFCDLGKENELFPDTSVLSFFRTFSPAADIIYFQNAVAVDQTYIALLDSILLEGQWNLKEEVFSRPILLVDQQGNQQLVEEKIVVTEEIVFSNGTMPVNLTYFPDMVEEKKINGTEYTYLGVTRSYGRPSTPKVSFARIQTKVTRTYSPISHVSQPVTKTNFKPTYVSSSIPKKSVPNLQFSNPIASKFPSTKTAIPRPQVPKTSPAENDRIQQLKETPPIVIGRLSISGYLPNSNTVKQKIHAGLVYVDTILSAIYKGYYSVRSQIFNWVDSQFNAWHNKWMRSVVKSILDSTVFKGTSWFVNQVKNYIKTWVSILYTYFSMQMNAYKLFAMMTLWAISKFASEILKYFGKSMDAILSALSSLFKINLDAVKKAIKGWIDKSVNDLNSTALYLENEIKSTMNYMIDEFKKSIFWKVLSAMGEIAKAVLIDVLNIMIKDLLFLSITAPQALRPKFTKMVRSLESFRDATLTDTNIAKIINTKYKDKDAALLDARILRKVTIPITDENSRRNEVTKINKIAEKKPVAVFVIPWFDFLNGEETDTAKNNIMKDYRSIIGHMAWRVMNNPKNYGLHHLINRQAFVLMPQTPDLLAKTFEALKVDMISPMMHGDLDGSFKVAEGLNAKLDEVSVMEGEKLYTGSEYISLKRNFENLNNEINYYEEVKKEVEKSSIPSSQKKKMEKVLNNKIMDMRKQLTEINTELKDYQQKFEQHIQEVEQIYNEFKPEYYLPPERIEESLKNSKSIFINADVCYGSKVLDKVNKPTFAYRNAIKATDALKQGHMFTMHILEKNNDGKSFEARKSDFVKNYNKMIKGTLLKHKNDLGLSNAKQVAKKLEGNQWKPNPVKYVNAANYKSATNIEFEMSLGSLASADDIRPPIAAEKLTKSSSEAMIKVATVKGHDSSMIKEIIKQYLLTLTAVIIAVNLAAWFIKSYAGLTTVSIVDIKEYGFALIDQNHKSEIKKKFLTDSMTIFASAVFAIMEDASDMAELVKKEELEIPLFMIAKVGEYLLKFFETSLGIPLTTYEETDWKTPINLLKSALGGILLLAAASNQIAGIVSLIVSMVVWNVLSAVFIPL